LELVIKELDHTTKNNDIMMKNKLLTFSLLLTIFLAPALRADEGMWIPLLIEKYNIKLMQEKGFKLTAEDIYSINKACMKDAIIQFGGGCTGEVISPEGLLITNHHCGYGQIQKHSTLEHDYLTDGFWAMSREEELPISSKLQSPCAVSFFKSKSFKRNDEFPIPTIFGNFCLAIPKIIITKMEI
jgi:hypothetical protein